MATRAVFDAIQGFLEDFSQANSQQILTQNEEVRERIWQPIREGLQRAKSRGSQFELLRDGVRQAHEAFRTIAERIPKETLMGIARRVPSALVHGGDLTLARMLVTYGASNSRLSFEVRQGRDQGLGLMFTDDEVMDTFQLMAIARVTIELEGMARWIGKGASLVLSGSGELTLDAPDEVKEAVHEYERRRPRNSVLEAGGFFLYQPDPKHWSDFRTPNLVQLDSPLLIEAPLDSARWLYFDRFPQMLDAGGLARLLQAYDEAIKESWGAGADAILHFLTALATLIYYTTPQLVTNGEKVAFAPNETAEETEHNIGFVFGLARKGFLRFSREDMIHHLGRVRTALAPDEEKGKRLGAEFIDAFLFQPERNDWFDFPPFLHSSTGAFFYIDMLLLWDFLTGVLEKAKHWYSSQHGDRFVLDLKQWLDVELPGFVVAAKFPIRQTNGGRSDIDLLVGTPDCLWVIECKAYGKSADYMTGAPEAVNARRAKIRKAIRQADRIAKEFGRIVAEGGTEFPRGALVMAAVCTPDVEFLKPPGEFGFVSGKFPRVMTPEELLELGALSRV